MRYLAVLTLTFVLASSTAGVALAQETPTEVGRRAVDIERGLMSPFCPGLTLYTCTSPAAAEWRRDIHEMVGAGMTDPEIRERLQARVPGFDISGQPAGERSWTLPVTAGILATLLFFVAVWRIRRSEDDGDGDDGEPERLDDDEAEALDARIDAELELLDAA
jgi:cytochrome c-type biogenesis protein CcmH/NrfF